MERWVAGGVATGIGANHFVVGGHTGGIGWLVDRKGSSAPTAAQLHAEWSVRGEVMTPYAGDKRRRCGTELA